MGQLPWPLIAALAMTGVLMALMSSLIGMRPRVENPAWWGLYVVWIAIVLVVDAPAPFLTILFASGIAGLLHGITQATLLDHYKRNNPWHAERLKGPRSKLTAQFVAMGVGVGTAFGALVGVIAWGLSRL